MFPQRHGNDRLKLRRTMYAYYGTGTRKRIGSVLHGSGFSCHEARGAKRKYGLIGLS